MKRHAKASSAGSTKRQAMDRGRSSLLVFAAFAFVALLVVASASASKEIANYFGSASGTGSLGGEFNGSRDVAVNVAGNGPGNPGDIYVADENNHRVQRFDAGGKFISAWGADVIQATKPGDVVDTDPFEVCTVATDCKAGVASGGNGATSGDGTLSSPQAVAVDEDTGNVYVSDRGNYRINMYSGSGEFIASWGFDVDATTAPTGYEVCPAADVCKVGLAGAGTGQIGNITNADTLGIAVSPPDGNAASGTVFLADSENRRVNTYDPDGSSPGSFGSSANFGATQPRKIAVDSRGIVYASNSNGGGQIERYDSQNANGGGVGFLAPILAPGNEVQEIHFQGFEETDPRQWFRMTCPNGEKTVETAYLEIEQGSLNVQSLLNKSCASESFSASGTPPNITLTYKGAFAGTNVPPVTCESTIPEGLGGTCSVTTIVDGYPAPLLPGPVTVDVATPGLAVDPDSDGPGPDEDELLVLRNPLSGNAVVQQFGPSHDPGLTVAPTLTDDTHGANSEFPANFNEFSRVHGLGLNGTTGQLLIPANGNVPGVGEGHRVYVLNELSALPTPVLSIDPVSVKGETTATFSGTVDPKGNLVSCRFQYSTDQLSWVDVPEPDCASLAKGSGAQAVSQGVTGLDPNTHYFVRLAAARPFIPNSTTVSPGVKPFVTDAAPPVVSAVGAVQVADKSARLVATIDPRHSPTGYIFRYGITPALGSSTAPLDIGDGTTPITVSQVIGGLSPDTTYYFRVEATNLIGTTTSGGNSLRTRATPLPLPEGRRYEQVTPIDKNYGDADSGYGVIHSSVSPDGNAAAFCPSNQFGDPPGRMTNLCAQYISRRTSTGWQTPNNLPSFCRVDPFLGNEEGGMGVYPSPDYSRVVVMKPETATCPVPPLDPAAPLLPNRPSFNLYLQDPGVSPPSYHLLNPQASDSEFLSQVFAGGSMDFSHVVYQSHRINQTAPPDSPPPGDFKKLYDWEREGHGDCVQPGGCLTLVSKDTSNMPFTTPSSIPATGFNRGLNIMVASAVSRDGDRIYFTNPVSNTDATASCGSAGCELYMRENAAVTHDVSASECTVDCGLPQSKADYFIMATPSGAEAFFASCAKLTDDSNPEGQCENPRAFDGFGEELGSKLYRWDRDGAPGHRLVDLTADHEPGDGVQANFGGLIGQSDDGEVAYFIAGNQIVSGAPTFEGEKLYRWEWNGGNPVVDYLGPYQILKGRWEMNLQQRDRSVTPDGQYMMLYSELRYDPAADADSDADIYRWDEAGGWACVSCQLPGVASRGDVNLPAIWLAYYTFMLPEIGSLELRTYMSDDGQRIFFGTPDALVPEDVNAENGCPLDTILTNIIQAEIYPCEDVYEWHDGNISLISSGTSDESARLIGSTPSGDDVFFFTRQSLVGWDVDSNVDIYTARVGGGFPEPPSQPATCEGEACRSAVTVAPSGSGAGTAQFEGPGNPPPARGCPKGKVRRKGSCVSKRKQKKRAAKHQRRASR